MSETASFLVGVCACVETNEFPPVHGSEKAGKPDDREPNKRIEQTKSIFSFHLAFSAAFRFRYPLLL